MKHNWKDVRQGLVDDLAVIKKSAKLKLSQAIAQSIETKSKGQIHPIVSKAGTTIKFKTKDDNEAVIGQKYFAEAFLQINQQFIDNHT